MRWRWGSRWKTALKHYKNINEPNIRFWLLALSIPTEEILQVHGQNCLWQIFQLSSFVLSREKCHHQSHWIRNFWFFFPYFGFSSPSSLNVIVCKRYGFFSVLAAIIWKNSHKRPWIENDGGFAVHSSTWPRGAKGAWRVSSWLAISNTHEKIWYFFTCLVTAFLRAENPCITCLMI